ncbi:MAG: DivIVA domain-containing protein [Gemmatimonadetes bacterium]|nr:DivIVA domain-containing protein [Gemmatimonadota bacterium]
MIDLTPLDVRKKRGDFKKTMRGYDPQEVDVFLELVAERLEVLVRDNIQLRSRAETLEQQLSSSAGRERAVQEALVTAQELRADIRAQAQREADLLIQEAQAEARQRVVDSERRIELLADSLSELERRRLRFLKTFRQLLERELDGVEVEEARAPLEERAIEMNLGGGREEEGGDAASTMDADAQGRATAERILAAESADEPLLRLDASVHELAELAEKGETGDAFPRTPKTPPDEDLFSLPDVHLPGDEEAPDKR